MADTPTAVNIYDFDGTVTSKDTLIQILRQTFPTRRLMAAVVKYSPLVFLMKLGLASNGRVKERVFAHFFGGWNVADFDRRCREFAEANKSLLRVRAMENIAGDIARGERVVVVTASIENWVAPFFSGMPVEVIGTRAQTHDGVLTGGFDGLNCHGPEKVRRFRERYSPQQCTRITAYGDSSGDREILALADHSYYKPFRDKSV